MKLKKMSMRNKMASPNIESADAFADEDNFGNDDKDMPVQRNSANARERARMRVLSSAFYRLKTIIPWVPHDTKLSKLDTLRLARNYIAYLAATLDGQQVNAANSKLPLPQKMTWPYIFQVPDITAGLCVNKTSPTEAHHEHDESRNGSGNYSGSITISKYSDMMDINFKDDESML